MTSCYSNDSQSIKAKQIEKDPVKNAYNNYTELLSMESDAFSMPEYIETIDFDEIYRFSINRKIDDIYDNESQGNTVFKAFFGAEFDEKECKFIDNNGDKIYSYLVGDEIKGSFYNGEIVLYSLDIGELLQDNDNTTIYDIKKEGDKILNLAGGDFTVNSVINSATSELINIIGDTFSQFTVEPKSICTVQTNKGTYSHIVYGLCYKNVPIEAFPSPMFTLSNENGMEMQECYQFRNIVVETSSDKKIEFINAMAPYVFYDKEKLEYMISLSGAVDILKNELAPNSNYNITDVKLEYCSKTKKPSVTTEADYGNIEAENKRRDIIRNMHDEFVPTWCFIVDRDERSSFNIKVNAITGELTLDM